MFGDFIVVLAWECNHAISSVTQLSGGLRHRTAACLLSFQEHNWVIRRLNYFTQKGIWTASFSMQRNSCFSLKQNSATRNHVSDKYVALLPPRKLGSCSNLSYSDFTNIMRKMKQHVSALRTSHFEIAPDVRNEIRTGQSHGTLRDRWCRQWNMCTATLLHIYMQGQNSVDIDAEQEADLLNIKNWTRKLLMSVFAANCEGLCKTHCSIICRGHQILFLLSHFMQKNGPE